MTSAKELHHLAALAAGHEIRWSHEWPGGGSFMRRVVPEPEHPGSKWVPWNPLVDDGDALRLRNRINAAVVDEGGQVCVSVSRYPFAPVTIRNHYEADTPTGHASPQAVDTAVRRAIFLAAVEIGRHIEQK